MTQWSAKAFWRGLFASTYKNKISVVLLTLLTLLITKYLVYLEICYSAHCFGAQHPVYLNVTVLSLERYFRRTELAHKQWHFHPVVKVVSPL